MTSKLNKIVLYFTSIVLANTLLVHAEPSVYGFGSVENINDAQMNNTQVSANTPRTMASLQQHVAEQDERIDGLTTIIEGLSASLNELQQRSGQINTSTIEENRPSDDALLQKLAAMIDEINAKYVSKEELQKVLGRKSTGSNVVKEKQSNQTDFQGKSNAQLYSEGVRYFVKKRYEEAQKRFTLTDAKRYKPAASNYYLGEIAYYSKKYEDAIFYFKKSAGIYDKASYIDTLLLHTAVSLEKSGDKAQAKAFYENIIQNYAGKKTAKIAKERLKKL